MSNTDKKYWGARRFEFRNSGGMDKAIKRINSPHEQLVSACNLRYSVDSSYTYH